MQLCAYDSKKDLVFAHQAAKQCDYQCIECGDIIRLRSGIHRQPHFYHIQPNGSCRLNGKGMEHIMVQNHLKTLLPNGEVELECRFPEIGRIADAAWIPKRLIFEIQYSPITADEVKARNRDYASLGYQVVWILHDSRYNKYKLTAAEHCLRRSPHYFTNINNKGIGIIYDQPALTSFGVRFHSLAKKAIDPHLMKDTQNIATAITTPQIIKERLSHWKTSFNGDYLTLSINPTIDRTIIDEYKLCLEKERELEKRMGKRKINFDEILAMPIHKALQLAWQKWIVTPYIAILRLILERGCKQ